MRSLKLSNLTEIRTGPACLAKISQCLLLFFVTLFLNTGCLTRTSNPTLPYIKPANSAGTLEQASGQVASRIQDIESEIQKLRDKLERLQSTGSEDKNVRELSERVSQLEKQIGMQASKKAGLEDFPNAAGSGSASGKNTQRDDSAQPRSSQAGLDHSDDSGEIRSAAVGPDEKAYRQAYSTFKSGSLEQAVTQFEDYVKKNPKSQFVPSAIYWIGEARLEQGRFDEAVLQFDRVIKEYPGSKKELSALFKQGQAFEKMGDIKSAKIIFQKLVKDHPHSTQGRLAASRLKSLANTD